MKIKKFQEGGMAPEMDPAMAQSAGMEQGAPGAEMGAAGAEQDPIMMLAQASMQAVQEQNCERAFQVCEAFLQLVQQAQGGAPEQGPVEEAPQGEPVFKRGGKIKGRMAKKCANGIKIESKRGDIHKDKNRHDNRF